MTDAKHEGLPEDVMKAARAILWEVQGARARRSGAAAIIARALLAAEQRGAERERGVCETAIEKANERVGGIETPLMRGDNLAVTLCTHFDDGGGDEDDTGWCAAATEGYHEVVAAIREHYANAIRGRKA